MVKIHQATEPNRMSVDETLVVLEDISERCCESAQTLRDEMEEE
jgi:hypothetical protein